VTPVYRYRLAGLGFQSSLPLPELGTEWPEAPEADVLIAEGAVPLPPQGPAPRGGMAWSSTPERCLLDIHGVARFRVSGGQRITFERAGGVGDDFLRLYLLGSVLGVLWHQRGLLPLHAGAVAIDGRAWAFVGQSGAGKSSLVVTMAACGAGYLCDDVCVVQLAADTDVDRGALVWPGLARLRVSPEICALLTLADTPPLDPMGKHTLAPRWPRPSGTRPLAGVVVLETDRQAAQPALERLDAAAALGALLTHTYRPEYLSTEQRARHFRACAALAAQVPVYRLRRPWGTQRLRDDAERLITLLGSLGGRDDLVGGSGGGAAVDRHGGPAAGAQKAFSPPATTRAVRSRI
jgi:hypothetical protein